jgi:hypothetical protein
MHDEIKVRTLEALATSIIPCISSSAIELSGGPPDGQSGV